jgi:hypothetical protein
LSLFFFFFAELDDSLSSKLLYSFMVGSSTLLSLRFFLGVASRPRARDSARRAACRPCEESLRFIRLFFLSRFFSFFASSGVRSASPRNRDFALPEDALPEDFFPFPSTSPAVASSSWFLLSFDFLSFLLPDGDADGGGGIPESSGGGSGLLLLLLDFCGGILSSVDPPVEVLANTVEASPVLLEFSRTSRPSSLRLDFFFFSFSFFSLFSDLLSPVSIESLRSMDRAFCKILACTSR